MLGFLYRPYINYGRLTMYEDRSKSRTTLAALNAGFSPRLTFNINDFF